MKQMLAALLALAFTTFPPLEAMAQPARKPARIAYVYLFDIGPSAPNFPGFRARLAELG
jgi:hypothetical protein